jgi:hypothetical protein
MVGSARDTQLGLVVPEGKNGEVVLERRESRDLSLRYSSEA